MKHFLVILLFILCGSLFSQKADSAAIALDSAARARAIHKKNYSGPRRASIMSAILPGLGQVYNRKFWKVPIIYAGLGGFGYFFVSNHNQYKIYQKNLRAAADDDPNTVNEMYWMNASQLQVEKLRFKKYRDYCAVGLVAIYILNIVDANVDAHLKTFDVSDDLSLSIDPWQEIYQNAYGLRASTGISLKLNFK